MARVLVFDVNETLLDLKALDSHFEHIFGDGTVRDYGSVNSFNLLSSPS